MTHLNKNEFADAVRKGLGRAYLHVKNHGDADIQDALLNACLHDLRYDTQAESNRSGWLMQVIKLTGNQPWYEQRIVAALESTTDITDPLQLFPLCGAFAKEGNARARDAVYTKFTRNPLEWNWAGGCALAEMDGLGGFLSAAEIIGARLLSDPEEHVSDDLFCYLQERYGKERVLEAIGERALQSEQVKKYLDHVQQKAGTPDTFSDNTTYPNTLGFNSPENIKKRTRTKWPLSKILAAAENAEGEHPSFYRAFGKCAEEDEIESIFKKLLSENRPEQLIRLLWVFQWRPLPALDDRIIGFACSDNEGLRSAAIDCLSYSEDERVHDLALRIFENPQARLAGCGIQLLKLNYRKGDNIKIENLLRQLQGVDIDPLWCAKDVLDVAENSGRGDMPGPLLWVYENIPCACSYCRGKAVKLLLENGSAPPDILQECLHDCNTETSAAAQVHLKSGQRQVEILPGAK